MGAAFAVTLLLVGCTTGSPQDANVLEVAVIAPFSGDYASLGSSVRNGVILAAEAWNASGGVLGTEVQLVLEDSQCDYVEGRAAAQAALDEGVSFIIGAVCSDASEGVAQVASAAGVLQISSASVDPGLTLDADDEVRPTVFRVPVTDPDQGVAAAAFARDVLGAERVAIMYADGSPYGSSLSVAFRDAFEAAGGEIVALEAYDQDAESFFENLDPVRAADPDLLYLPGYYDVANLLVAQARDYGLLQPVLGSDGWDSPGLDLDAVDGAYYTTHFFADEPSPEVQAWVDNYQARYLAPPGALATLSYDAADLLFTAIRTAGIADPLAVAGTLESLTFDGISGEMTFNAVHNPVKSVIVVKANNGRVSYVGRYAATGESTGD